MFSFGKYFNSDEIKSSLDQSYVDQPISGSSKTYEIIYRTLVSGAVCGSMSAFFSFLFLKEIEKNGDSSFPTTTSYMIAALSSGTIGFCSGMKIGFNAVNEAIENHNHAIENIEEINFDFSPTLNEKKSGNDFAKRLLDIHYEQEIEPRYMCPISHEIMSDPVVASDGFTYERSEIQTWMEQKAMSPMTREPLLQPLYNNKILKGEILDFVEKEERYYQTIHSNRL